MSSGITTGSGVVAGAPASIPVASTTAAFGARGSSPAAPRVGPSIPEASDVASSRPDGVTRTGWTVAQAPNPSSATLPWDQGSGAGGSGAPGTASGDWGAGDAGTDRPLSWSS